MTKKVKYPDPKFFRCKDQIDWKKQAENIKEIGGIVGELLKETDWKDVGNALKKATASYEESRKKLIESNQSVVKKIGKLERLGLAPKRSTAKIKTGTRLSPTGKESIIPAEFIDNINE